MPELRPIPYTGAAHILPSADAPRIMTGDFFTSYLKISEGCNHKCAFCIIPKIRGPHESRPPAEVVAERHGVAGLVIERGIERDVCVEVLIEPDLAQRRRHRRRRHPRLLLVADGRRTGHLGCWRCRSEQPRGHEQRAAPIHRGIASSR